MAFIPIIPVASGFGWDGVFYGKVAMNFQDMIGHIDSYHANRIFPGVLIHYAYRFLNLPLKLGSVLLGYRIYNIVILTGAAVLWVLISKRLALNAYYKWLGFCALFVNYPLLNLHFYYPALTDGTAFLFGLIMLYSYLERKSILLLSVTALSFFCWPAGIIVGFLLFIYANAESASSYHKRESTPPIFFLILLSPFLAFIGLNLAGEVKHLIVQFELDGRILPKFNYPGVYEPFNAAHFINAGLNALYLTWVFWFVLKNIDLKRIVASTFQKKFVPRLVISAVILSALVYIRNVISSPSLPTLTPFAYFANYFTGANVRFPFQFLFCQITYWGPAVILMLLFFKRVAAYLQKAQLPMLLVFLYAVLFSINSEGRPIINFYPFLVVILLQAVDISAFNTRVFTMLFVTVSLIYSKIWFFPELPASLFPNSIWTGLDKFPMQRYFMNFGLFINAEMYWLHTAAAAVLIALFYCVIKRPKAALIAN